MLLELDESPTLLLRYAGFTEISLNRYTSSKQDAAGAPLSQRGAPPPVDVVVLRTAGATAGAAWLRLRQLRMACASEPITMPQKAEPSPRNVMPEAVARKHTMADSRCSGCSIAATTLLVMAPISASPASPASPITASQFPVQRGVALL